MNERQIEKVIDVFKYLRKQCADKSTQERVKLVEQHFGLRQSWHLDPDGLVGVFEVQEAGFISALNQVADYVPTTENEPA